MKKLYLKALPAVRKIKPAARGRAGWGSVLLIGLGSFLLVSVSAPIVTYELVEAPQLRVEKWLTPLPEVKGVASVAEAEEPDYTQVSSWFPNAPQARSWPSKITSYTVDIPSLGIKNAVVEIGGEDLKQSLIQYGGTANPGEWGTPVIFGHSILRQFYNPGETNPRRYLSIFSTIMTLKEGEKIYINYDGIKYSYKVARKYQVEPEEVEILAQRFDQKTLRLITCVPEGTYLHRGVIEAVLEPI